MSEKLAARLIGERLIPEATVRTAAARQLVYGGSLDTALLEMGAVSEAALWARLVAATGLPAPDPALCDAGDGAVAEILPASDSARLRAVAVAVAGGGNGGTVHVLVAEPVAEADVRRAASASGLQPRLYVVPEVRLVAARHRVYGEPPPARYAPLLAKLVGPARFRRPRTELLELGPGASEPVAPAEPIVVEANGETAAALPVSEALSLGDDDIPAGFRFDGEVDFGATPMSPMPDDSPADPRRLSVASPAAGAEARAAENSGVPDRPLSQADSSDLATEAMCRRARDIADKGRPLALRALRSRVNQTAVQALLGELRQAAEQAVPRDAAVAAEALAELRDPLVIPILVDRLAHAPEPLARALERALVALSIQRFGRSRRRWSAWWRRNAARPRGEWLVEGLGHKDPALRQAAFEELRTLAGDSFGYAPDQPKREREQAQRRYRVWWNTVGKLRLA
jgi:hypothetical protein